MVSPAIGGILMGYEVARQMGLPNIFAEREDGVMEVLLTYFLKVLEPGLTSSILPSLQMGHSSGS